MDKIKLFLVMGILMIASVSAVNYNILHYFTAESKATPDMVGNWAIDWKGNINNKSAFISTGIWQNTSISQNFLNVTSSTSPETVGKQPFSQMAWVYLSQNNDGSTYILNRGDAGSGNRRSTDIWIDNAEKANFRTCPYGNTTCVTSTSTTAGAGKAFLIIAVYDGSTQYLYINGTLEDSDAQPNGVYNTSDTYFIGASQQNGVGTNGFNGTIDEVAIFNKSLSANEVMKIWKMMRAGYRPYENVSYYIATNGSNSNNGFTIDTPFRTLDMLASTPIDGNQIYIRGGTYVINTSISLNFSSNSKRVRIGNYNNEYPSLIQCYNPYLTANALWTDISTTTGIANTWKSDASWLSTAYPLGYFQNNTELITQKCFNSNVGISGSCSYDEWFTKYNMPQIWVNQTASPDEIYLMLPGGQYPNNLYLCIADEFATLNIEDNDGRGEVIIEGLNFNLHRRAINVNNSDNVTIQYNTMDEGIASIIVEGLHHRGQTIIQFNNFTGHNPDFFYNNWIKNMFEESDVIRSNNDVIGAVQVLNNTFISVTGGVSLVTDSATEECGTKIKGNIWPNQTRAGESSQFELENYACNLTVSDNKIFGNAMSSISIGALNVTGYANIAYNVIYNRNYIINNATSSDPTYCMKIYSPGSVLNQNVNFSHNTCVGYGRGWYALENGIDIYNFTVKDNIFMTRNYSSPAVRGTGTDLKGNYWDYNLYYTNYTGGNLLSYWNNDTNPAAYTSLAAALAGTQANGIWDINSKQGDPQFVNAAAYDLRPRSTSPACSMSSTGSYVGALPCYDAPPDPITNLHNLSVTNDTIRINWTNPTDYGDQNNTLAYINGVNFFNFSKTDTDGWATLLSPSTAYRFDFITTDNAGNKGSNATITITTYANNESAPTGTFPAVIDNSAYVINFTFLQKPYFLSLNLTGNNTNPKVYDYQNDYYFTYADHSYLQTHRVWSASYMGYGEYHLYDVFRDYANYSGKQVYLNYSVDLKDGVVVASCFNSTGGYSYITTITGTGSWVVQSAAGRIDGSCLGNNITIRYAGNPYSSYMDMGDDFIYSEAPYYIKMLGNTVFNSTSESNNSVSLNLTSQGNAMTGNILNFTFYAGYQNTFNYNVSMAYLYTKSINVSVYKTDGVTILNPSCEFNGETVTPKTSLVNFNSTGSNIITCALAGYFNTSQTLLPSYDAINLSMSSITVNISLYDEHLDKPLNYNFSLEFFNGMSFNFSTENGSIVFDGDSLGEYKFYYWSKDLAYPRRTRYVNVATLSDVDLRIYSLNTTWGEYKSLYIIDDSGSAVNHAKVKMLRQFVDCNCFRTVEEAYTDEQGYTRLFPELYTATYKFIVEYDGATKKITNETTLDTRTLQLKISLIDDGSAGFYHTRDVATTLSFDSGSNTWDFTYNDPTDTMTSARIEVIRQTPYLTQTICQNSGTENPGTLLCDISAYANKTGSITAKGYITSGGQEFTADLSDMSYQKDYLSYGLSGVVLSMLIVLVMVFIGSWKPDVMIWFYGLGMIICMFTGLLYLQVSWFIGTMIVGVILIKEMGL